MSFTIKPATRQGVKPLIGIFGKSGGGKTLTALLIARGLVGPSGRITLIDSESGRGSLFADVVPGGYSVLDIDAPFSPDKYAEAVEMAESQSDIMVCDSMSHEWSGEGGVIDMQEAELDRMAGNDWGKREKCKMAAWIKPKLAHKKFIMRLLRLKCPLICCLRGEEKTHMEKNGNKNEVVTDTFSSPLFDPRFIFEMLISLECIARKNPQSGLMEGGFVIPRKITHPSVAQFLPKENEQAGIKFGQDLAAWCNAAGKPVAKSLKDLQIELWTLLKPKRIPGEKSWLKSGAIQFLVDECGLEVNSVDGLVVEQLESLILKAKSKLTN